MSINLKQLYVLVVAVVVVADVFINITFFGNYELSCGKNENQY
jgi:hypothetical protein